MFRTAFNIFFFNFIVLIGLFAQSTSWKGTTSTSWTTASNWTNGVPTASADVTIGDANFTGAFDPTLGSTVTVNSLTLGSTNTPFLTVSNKGTLTVNGNISIASGATLDQNRRTLTVKGNWINNGTYSTSSNNALIVFAGSTQSISGTPASQIFKKVTLNAGSTLTLSSNITTDNTVTINGTLDPQSFRVNITGGSVRFNSGAYLYVKASVMTGASGNFSANPTFSAGSTVEFAGSSAQTVTTAAITLSNLIISNPVSVTLGANVTINTGDVDVTDGTLDLSTFTLSRSAAGGTLTLSDGTFLRCANTTTPFPANFTTNTLSASSTVVYYASGAQTVSTRTYGHLLLSGSGTKSTGGAVTVNGNLTTSGTVTFSPGAAVTVFGTDTIGSGTTFSASSFSHVLNGNLVNNGTLTGGTSTITFAGSSASISGSGTFNFNHLLITGAGITADASSNITVGGNFSTSGSGTFTHTSGGSGTMTMSSATGSISGTGSSFNNLTIGSGGAISSTSTFDIAGDLNASGSLTASSGTITLSGTSKSISGAGSLTFSALKVTGTITTARSFSIASNVTVTGSLTASAGTVTFTGTSTLDGTANLFNATLNGSSLQLGTGSVLGIAGSLTLTSGTFNVTSTTPNTVTYNSSGAQSVAATTYHNLTFSNGGTKTAAGASAVNGDLTIGSGVTYSAGTFTHTISGNFINSGTFTAGSSTISFTGAADASITGASAFSTLTVNKSTGMDILTLQNNVSTGTLNMTSGRMVTGSNSVTVTSSRSGNGIVVGTIIRTHSFSNSTAYAFEGPSNTITFTSGAPGITSVSVTTTIATVADFSFGSSVNREYSVSVSGGSYAATMRLHYEDDELNGNTESGLELWHYTSDWTTYGKSGNNTTSNYVELDTLTSLNGRWSMSEFVKVIRWTGAASSAWENSANWSVVQGSPDLPPGVTDVVQIGDSAFTNQPTIASAVSVRSISFGSAQAATLTISSGSLTTTGNIEGTWSASRTHAISVGSNSLTVGGSLTLGDGTAGHILSLSVGSGSVQVSGILTQTSSSSVTVGSGSISIGGDYNRVSGTFTAGTGTVIYNGSAAQTIAGGINYYAMTVNKSSGSATLGTSANTTNNLTVQAGTLVTNANIVVSGNLSISSGASLNGNSATITVGGNWSNSGTFNSGTGTVNLNGGGAQSITATTFNHLVINKGLGTATPSGNLTINGNLTVSAGELDLTTFTANRSVLGGTLTLSAGATLSLGGANNFPSNFSVNSISATGTVQYNGTSAQSVSSQTYGHLTFSNGTTNAKSFAGTATVAGTLTVNSGATVNAGTQTITLLGNLTVNGTFTPSTGTILMSGASKTITGTVTFNNLTVSGSITAANDVTVTGTLSNTGTFASGSTTLTLSGGLNNTGTMTNSGSVIFSGTGSQTIAMNSGFTSTGTVFFNGTVSPTLADITAPTLANVTVNNSGGITPGQEYTVNGTFTVANGASFAAGAVPHTFKGTFTNNGTVSGSGTLTFSPSSPVTLTLAGTSFTSTGTVVFGGTGAITLSSGVPTINNLTISNSNGAGISLVSGWTVSGDLTVQTGATLNAGTGLSHTLAGNFTSNGTFSGGTSTFTFNNTTNKNISATGTAAFYHLTVASGDSVTLASNIPVQGDLTNNGILVNDGVVITMSGSSNASLATSSASFDIDQLTINKSSATVTLADNITNLTDLTISGGTLDQSTFSLAENGTDGASLTIAAGGLLKIGGTNGLALFTNGYTIASSATVEFAGTTQTIQSSPTYGNLTISASGTKTAGGALTIAGNFSLAVGTFAAGSNTHSIQGNWTMSSGTLTGTSTITVNGSTDQTFSSSGAFNNLTVNKSSGTLSLTSSLTVGGVLTLTSGNIVTGSHSLIISSTGSVSRTSGHIVGNLQKNVATGTPTRTFEIGDASNYSPVSLVFASVTTAGNLTVSTTKTEHDSVLNSGINPNKNVNRFWSMTNSGIVFTTFSATFTFVSGDIDAGASTANFNVSKYSSNTWSVQTAGTRTATTTQATAIASFGDFIIGESGKIWNGSFSSLWNDAANWTPSGVPGSSDAVTIGIASTININTAAVTADLTVGHSGATVTLQTGNSLTISGNFTVTAGTFNTETSFPTVSGTTTFSGGTTGFTGTGNQTVPALNYRNLTISGSRGANNITLEADTIRVAGIFTSSASFSSGSFVTAGNMLEFNGTAAQTIPAFNYRDLLISGSRGNDTVSFASSGTLGIAGTLTLSASSVRYSVTGSTLNFNGTGAQSVPAFTYENLTISGARGSSTVTLASDSIHISGTFAPTATSVSYSQSGTVFNFNGTSSQSIPAFTYNTLVFSGNGTKTIGASLTSSNDLVNRAGSQVSVSGGVTVQINGSVNNAGTIINDGTVIAGN